MPYCIGALLNSWKAISFKYLFCRLHYGLCKINEWKHGSSFQLYTNLWRMTLLRLSTIFPSRTTLMVGCYCNSASDINRLEDRTPRAVRSIQRWSREHLGKSVYLRVWSVSGIDVRLPSGRSYNTVLVRTSVIGGLSKWEVECIDRPSDRRRLCER